MRTQQVCIAALALGAPVKHIMTGATPENAQKVVRFLAHASPPKSADVAKDSCFWVVIAAPQPQCAALPLCGLSNWVRHCG